MKKVLVILGLSVVLALGGTAVSATPMAPVTQKAEAVGFTGCYHRFDGTYWCYRYGCTLYELVKYNCYNGYIRVPMPWYA